MKCPKCGGTGFVPTNVFGVNGAIKCDFCDGSGVFITNAVEPMTEQTNEEWFCQLPTGEKAEFFANIYPKSVGEALIKISNGDKDRWLEWLKQPHQEE